MSISSRKKRDSNLQALGWFKGTENICAGDQCIIKQSGGYTQPVSTLDLRGVPIEEAALSDIFSVDVFKAMVQAAKFGYLYSFLTALPNDLINRHFIRNHFTPNQIFYARQAISALTMLSLSSALGMTDIRSFFISAGLPAASTGLKYSGYSETVSQLAPVAILAVTQLATDISHWGKTALTLLAGLGGGWLGKQTASTGYRMMNDLFSYVTGTTEAAPASQRLHR